MSTAQKTITVQMTSSQHKRYLAFLEADEVARGVKRALKEMDKARKGEIELKSAYDLINEL